MAPIPGMTRALWKSVTEGQVPMNLHPGILFNRFLSPGEQGIGQFSPLFDREGNPRVHSPFCNTLLERRRRYLDSLASLRWKARLFSARLVSRLAIGLGIPNPTENGLNLDHVHGLPTIPGSSLKGLCLAWAREEEGLALNDPDLLAIFGAQKDDLSLDELQASAGCVIFFDALPIPDSSSDTIMAPFELDIMNPHYDPYYESQGGKEPADYYNPKPITFLTVRAGTMYSFALAVRPPTLSCGTLAGKEETACIADKAEGFLKKVLSVWGVGAKTGVGYGLFELPHSN